MGIVASIIAAVAIGVGVTQTINAASHQPAAPALPPLPDPKKAGDTAKADVNNQRRLALLTGGLTDYTGGNATLGSGDINKTALLGN